MKAYNVVKSNRNENTDSDFFNLTAEDAESQMEAQTLLTRNSGSVVNRNPSQNTNNMPTSGEKYEDKSPGAIQAYQLLQIEQIPSQSKSQDSKTADGEKLHGEGQSNTQLRKRDSKRDN